MRILCRFILMLTLLSAAQMGASAQNGPSLPVAADAGRPVAIDTATYKLGPKDLIFVEVWKTPEYSRQLRVTPDGKITIPMIGAVQAADITPERLGLQLAEALAEYIKEPNVTVTVLEVLSKNYTMSGAIAKSGTYSMPVPVRIFDAINNAGGFAPFANKKEIIVIREGTTDRPVFNYDDYVKGKNLEKNINFFLQNGDTVHVK